MVEFAIVESLTIPRGERHNIVHQVRGSNIFVMTQIHAQERQLVNVRGKLSKSSKKDIKEKNPYTTNLDDLAF